MARAVVDLLSSSVWEEAGELSQQHQVSLCAVFPEHLM